ncbi:hypothetical protein AB4170_24390 [Vibrio splendidus]
MSNIPEDKLIVHYDDEFKDKFIEAMETLQVELDGFEFGYTIEELKESVIDDEEKPIDAESVAFVIDPDEFCKIYCDAIIEWEDDIEIRQNDILTLLSELRSAELHDYVEYFSSTLYLHRVSVISRSEDTYMKLLMLEPLADGMQVYFASDPSFHFSYKLSEDGHREPVDHHDSFVCIRGDNLKLERCRKVYKSYVFEANSVANAKVESYPNEPFDIDDYMIEESTEKVDGTIQRQLIVCEDTDKVIGLYNKAMCCDDDEVAILFYSKVIEFISETVVREKVTDEARKALASTRALNPDANFIKELQDLFKDYSYQKDADSLKLTVQSCGYFKDLEGLVPEFIHKKVKTEKKKSEWDALGTIADSITATRNSIAHAKSNYRPSGKEIPEDQYDQLTELLRLLSQQCIRWYSAQSPLVRVK